MFRKKDKKKFSVVGFLGDAATLVVASAACAVVYVVDKVTDAI